MIKSYVFIWTVFVCFFTFLLRAEEKIDTQEHALYAVTSLKCYLTQRLEEQLSPPSESEAILFADTEVINLWQTAFSEKSVLTHIQQAYHDYTQALTHSDKKDLYCRACRHAIHSLDTAWEKLNPYTANHAVPLVSACHRFVFNLNYPNFDDNPILNSQMRLSMRRYLLPLDHPMKPILDTICHSFRVLKNRDDFALAGFVTLSIQPTSKITLASHPALPGYLFKVYLDSDPAKIQGRPGWSRLTRRCEGAENVRKLIKKKNLQCFVVPDKWLYPPALFKIDQQDSKSVQPVFLAVTDMNLVSLQESVNAWKTQVTKKHVDELYSILSHGFASGFLPFNIPYTKAGKFACVDTEYPQREVDLKMAREYLSPEMRIYWDELVRKGGKL